ncbi:hypothetical protein HKK74_36530 [Actinomadura alba]|uniref:Uncharacterized protein n=1 Tax=Actinomadura alba TaxID=406431 RepID=A0ABR7M220_9ACTN|nr:hypothetical protein [Actinomadura alba]
MPAVLSIAGGAGLVALLASIVASKSGDSDTAGFVTRK